MKQQIIDMLTSSIDGLKAIYLFGSHAQGHALPESDIDIAVLTDYDCKLSKLGHRRMELSGAMHQDVDLVDLRQVELDFRFTILSTADRIYCVDQAYCDSYEMTCFSMYQRFELERASIVNDIVKRGYVRAR